MIACLGWGSLTWKREGLPVRGGWHTDGPQLPVEFTRVSGGERLTLVVTEGAPPVTVLWSALAVPSLDDAMKALAEREGVDQSRIHLSIGLWSPDQSSRHAEAAIVGDWATERALTAVTWTALKPGFPGGRGKPLTCEEALDHLRGIRGFNRENAEEYIRRAPAQIRTPYRAAIEEEFGWTAV